MKKQRRSSEASAVAKHTKELEPKLEEIGLSLQRKDRSRTAALNAALAGLRKEQDRATIIWHALAGFANGREGEEAGFRSFHAFTHLCCIRLEELFDDPTQDLRCFEDVEIEHDQTGKTPEDVFRSRATSLRQQIRAVLAWLACPNDSSAMKRYALEFLLEHGSEQSIQFSMDPTDKFDDTGNQGIPLFYWKHIYGYRTIFTPTAKFILDRLEQYHERDLTLDKAIPLIICKRPECGRFAVARRKTKDFCSDSCRTLYRQKNRPKVWAAYMRKYRSNSF
jgi:hypothetical protein